MTNRALACIDADIAAAEAHRAALAAERQEAQAALDRTLLVQSSWPKWAEYRDQHRMTVEAVFDSAGDLCISNHRKYDANRTDVVDVWVNRDDARRIVERLNHALSKPNQR
jgi:hypothetical protein